MWDNCTLSPITFLNRSGYLPTPNICLVPLMPKFFSFLACQKNNQQVGGTTKEVLENETVSSCSKKAVASNYHWNYDTSLNKCYLVVPSDILSLLDAPNIISGSYFCSIP
jgi:hypothetical protein